MIWVADRRILQPMIMIMLLYTLIIAGETAWCQASQKDIPIENWQLKFAVGSNFIPSRFDGFKIYLQRNLSRRSAVRFGAGLVGYNLDSERRNMIEDEPFDFEGKTDYDRDILYTAFDLSYIRYIKSQTALRSYFGIGPFFESTFFGIDQTYREFGQNPGSSLTDQDYEIFDTGLSTIMGAEWRLNHVLILQVEYGLRFHYIRTRTTYSNRAPMDLPVFIYENTRYYDYYRMDAGSIKTGVSVLF